MALSLGVKERRELYKYAGNGVTSLIEQSNNKVNKSTITTHSAGTCLDRNILVVFFNPRVVATFSKGVMVRVVKKDFRKVLRRFYDNKAIKNKLLFENE